MTANGKQVTKATTLDLAGTGLVENMITSLQQRLDPFGVTTSLMNAQSAWQLHPVEMSRALRAIAQDALTLQGHLARRAMGLPSEDVVRVNAEDARFADPAWTDVPTWDVIKETYLAITHRLEDMLYETPGLSDKERRRAAFWLREWLNAMAPTNFLLTNPVAQRKLVETKGQSLVHGLKHLMRDVKAKNIRMVEADAFKVGENLATTPGHVVHAQPAGGSAALHAHDGQGAQDPDRDRHCLDQQVLRPRPDAQEESGQVPDRPGLQRLHHELEEPNRRNGRRELR